MIGLTLAAAPARADEIDDLIAQADFEIVELEAASAKLPRTLPPQRMPSGKIIAFQNPERDKLVTLILVLEDQRDRLHACKKHGQEKYVAELADRGKAAANAWVLTQARGKVKRMPEKVLRANAENLLKSI